MDKVLAVGSPEVLATERSVGNDGESVGNVLTGVLGVLATDDIEIIDLSDASFSEETRLEPRYNKHGKLRGIAWRERNKDRKGVWYVGPRSTGQRKQQWDELRPIFERVEG